MSGMEENWKDKVWFICQKQHFLFKEYKDAGYMVFDPFIGCNMIFPRLFRIIHFKSKFPCKQIWFRKLPEDTPKIIIIREGIVTNDYLLWLRKKLPDTKIIGLFMNKICSTAELELLRKYGCEPATADPDDCKKYGISDKFSAIYLHEFKIPTLEKKSDIIYIGSAKKGREKALKEISYELEKQGLVVETYLTSPYPYGITLGKYMKKISYSKVLEKIGSSRAILHLSMGASSGITLRIVESVVNHYKLVTDDISIMDTDIYNKNNIFILGVDDITLLQEFLSKPFENVPDRYIESFYFDTDIINFFGE